MKYAGLTNTGVLHLGYVLVLVLLAVSGYEVFRLQSLNVQTRLDVYRRFLDQEQARATLRRSVWWGSNSARDYFLSHDPDRLHRLRQTLTHIEQDAESALTVVRHLDPARTANLDIAVKVRRYLDGLMALPDLSGTSLRPPFEHLRQLAPLRLAAMEALEDASRQSQQEVVVRLDKVAQQRVRTFRKLLAFFAVMFAVGVAIAWVTNRYARRAEQDRAVHAAETAAAKEELERLSARLVELQEDERRMLAQELHDEVGQALTAMRMEISRSLDVVREPEPRARLDRAKRLAEHSVRVVRNISLMLRPPILDDLGLSAALQWKVEELARRSGIHATFSSSGEQDLPLPDPIKTCLFRVAQEALNNCEKYAGATQVDVELVTSGKSLTLVVQDNGKGFHLEPNMLPAQGSGILGMRERVTRLQGTFRISSNIGAGTQIVAELPIQSISPQATTVKVA
ncbi:MAG: sensor histidine kinase [Bryobacterales bacterium]|nr:sensor histidine kinase [Bryobacterales bacterium]